MDGREHNLPTASEVAALIVDNYNIDEANTGRDIVVDHRSSGLQRIRESHPSFMALQYPLIFPYGEDGYRQGIIYRMSPTNKEFKRSFVTMREYYSFWSPTNLAWRTTTTAIYC